MTKIRVLGAWHDEAGRYIRLGGSWRKVIGITARVGGAWKTAAGYVPAFSASAPPEVDGFASPPKPTSVQVSATASVAVSGGLAPYTYSWTRISGDTRIVAQSATMATTTFAATLRNEEASATFSWVATDASGLSASGQTVVNLTAGGGF